MAAAIHAVAYVPMVPPTWKSLRKPRGARASILGAATWTVYRPRHTSHRFCTMSLPVATEGGPAGAMALTVPWSVTVGTSLRLTLRGISRARVAFAVWVSTRRRRGARLVRLAARVVLRPAPGSSLARLVRPVSISPAQGSRRVLCAGLVTSKRTKASCRVSHARLVSTKPSWVDCRVQHAQRATIRPTTGARIAQRAVRDSTKRMWGARRACRALRASTKLSLARCLA